MSTFYDVTFGWIPSFLKIIFLGFISAMFVIQLLKFIKS